MIYRLRLHNIFNFSPPCVAQNINCRRLRHQFIFNQSSAYCLSLKYQVSKADKAPRRWIGKSKMFTQPSPMDSSLADPISRLNCTLRFIVQMIDVGGHAIISTFPSPSTRTLFVPPVVCFSHRSEDEEEKNKTKKLNHKSPRQRRLTSLICFAHVRT